MFIPKALPKSIVEIVLGIIRSIKNAEYIKLRAQIFLYTYQTPTMSVAQLCELLEVSGKTVRKHQRRFAVSLEALQLSAQRDNRATLYRTVFDCFEDAPRSGRPRDFSPVQIFEIVSVCCEKPQDSHRPVTRWTSRELADEVVKRKIVPKISVSHVRQILRNVNLRPHRIKGWCFTTEKDQALFQQQAIAVCETYLEAPSMASEGVHIVSVDEKTGIQANEKLAETLVAKPQQTAKEETQYRRHGTVCLTAGWDVVLGRIPFYTIQETRNNEDFCDFIGQLVSHALQDKWVIVLDNLNTHSSEELVRWVARLEGISEDQLGDKKKRKGILGSMKSRREFLSAPERRIRFVYTPKHSSWLNQIENIFGVIQKRAISGASFKSKDELIVRLQAFIHYFNETFAKPMKWTYTGRPTEKENIESPKTWRQMLRPKTWAEKWLSLAT